MVDRRAITFPHLGRGPALVVLSFAPASIRRYEMPRCRSPRPWLVARVNGGICEIRSARRHSLVARVARGDDAKSSRGLWVDGRGICDDAYAAFVSNSATHYGLSQPLAMRWSGLVIAGGARH